MHANPNSRTARVGGKLIIAWAFELTPEGVKRESEVDRNQSIVHKTGKKLNTFIIVLLTVPISYLVFDKFIAVHMASGSGARGSSEDQR